MSETFHVVPVAAHEALVTAAYRHRGFDAAEAEHAARLATAATRHGIRTHNAIKALHLDEHFGSRAHGCVPRAEIRRLPGRFAACEVWDARKKKYGASNWYDWSVKNWGTKWNASEGYFDDEANRLVFNTAWDKPDPILQSLADRWGVTLGNRYHDEYDNKWHTSTYSPRKWKAVRK